MEIFKDLVQGSTEWHEARRGVITGTRLVSVMGTPRVQETLTIELLGEIISDIDENDTSGKSYAMEYGNVAEQVVKSEFVEWEITEVGFIKKNDWLGLSPDWLFEENGEIVGALEIKSPQVKSYVRYVLAGGIPEDYLWQVVQYFIVIDSLKYLDFVIFNAQIKDKAFRVRKIRVTRAELEEEIQKAKDQLEKFKANFDAKKKELLTAFLWK